MKIFYFWESLDGDIPAYLNLCIKTWEKNGLDCEIVRINYGNVKEYTHGLIDPEIIKRFSFPLQSDAIAAAVMFHNPGLFLDADTILLPGFNFDDFGKKTKMSVFGHPITKKFSMAFFFVPVKNNDFLRDLCKENEIRIKKQTEGFRHIRWRIRWWLKNKPMRVGWSYLGSNIVDKMILKPGYKNCVNVIDIYDAGCISHDIAIPAYLNFWFDNVHDVDLVKPAAKNKVLFLHNSWTPKSYTDLSVQEILGDKTNLSKILRYALGIPQPMEGTE